MGMNLNFSVEDINIEITDAGGEEVEETVEDQIADQEAQEEVEEASEEVETAAKFGMQLVAIHENLSFIKQHVQMFGVTKQMLHLVNANGQLGSAIGLSLPHYESDDEAEDIVMDDVPEAEVVVEAIGETLNRWKENIKKFFKMLWDKFKALGSAFMTRLQGLKKTINNLQNKFKKEIDKEKYAAMIEVTAPTATDYKTKWDAITKAIEVLVKSKPDQMHGYQINKKEIVEGLNFLGKALTEDKGFKVTSGKEKPKEEKIKLVDSWDKANIVSKFKESLDFIASYNSKQAECEKSIKEAEKIALASIKTEDSDKDAKDMITKQITVTVSTVTSIHNAFINEKLSLIRTMIAIAKRVPMVGDKKE